MRAIIYIVGYGRELSEYGIREFINVWIGPAKV